jgi:hypothetical protein
MANAAPQMPLRGTQNAPKFDGKVSALLPRFLEDVDILGTAAGITEAEKIRAAIRYADLEEAEGWELLDEATANPPNWDNFVLAVKKLYPGCEGANRYCRADIQYLVQEYRAKPMRTLEELGEYQRKFLKMARILIIGRKLSDLDRDALFMSGLPADLETQVRQRLLITKSAHHPSDPYPIDDTVDATKFLLTGSALRPLAAAPAATAFAAQPYYPAWAAPAPTPVVPQTVTPTAAPVIKQEQLNLQRTARRDCAFCADPSHFMGNCPLVDGYIKAGKASRGTDGRLYLPDGRRIPRVQGTRCLRECLDRLPASAPVASSSTSVVTAGIFSVTDSFTDAILDIEPSVFMTPVDQDSDDEADPAFTDPDFQSYIANAWAAFQADKKDKGKRVRFDGVEMPNRKTGRPGPRAASVAEEVVSPAIEASRSRSAAPPKTTAPAVTRPTTPSSSSSSNAIPRFVLTLFIPHLLHPQVNLGTHSLLKTRPHQKTLRPSSCKLGAGTNPGVDCGRP